MCCENKRRTQTVVNQSAYDIPVGGKSNEPKRNKLIWTQEEQESLSFYKIAQGSFREYLIFEKPGGAVVGPNESVFSM